MRHVSCHENYPLQRYQISSPIINLLIEPYRKRDWKAIWVSFILLPLDEWLKQIGSGSFRAAIIWNPFPRARLSALVLGRFFGLERHHLQINSHSGNRLDLMSKSRSSKILLKSQRCGILFTRRLLKTCQNKILNPIWILRLSNDKDWYLESKPMRKKK